jgi:hypothetical protein
LLLLGAPFLLSFSSFKMFVTSLVRGVPTIEPIVSNAALKCVPDHMPQRVGCNHLHTWSIRAILLIIWFLGCPVSMGTLEIRYSRDMVLWNESSSQHYIDQNNLKTQLTGVVRILLGNLSRKTVRI